MLGSILKGVENLNVLKVMVDLIKRITLIILLSTILLVSRRDYFLTFLQSCWCICTDDRKVKENSYYLLDGHRMARDYRWEIFIFFCYRAFFPHAKISSDSQNQKAILLKYLIIIFKDALLLKFPKLRFIEIN